MKKLSNKEKNAIYKHLLELDCPDLLAALIAERSQNWALGLLDEQSLSVIVEDSFIWSSTPEGNTFWLAVFDILCEKEGRDSYGLFYLNDDDYVEIAGHEHEEALALAMSTDIKENYTPEPDKTPVTLSFFDKVKLFMGKLVYKV